MRTYTWMAGICVAGVLASATAQETGRRLPALGEPVSAAVDMLPAQEAGGLKISLAADKAEAQAGDAVKLTLTFENVSQESLRVFMPIAKMIDDYLVIRAAGPSVLRSGVQVRNMMAFLPGPQSFPEIPPGEKRTLDLLLSGNPPTVQPGGVMFGAEGEYTIQVVYTYQGEGPQAVGAERPADMDFVPWRGSVVSEPIVVKLTGEFQAPPAGGRRMLLQPQVGR